MSQEEELKQKEALKKAAGILFEGMSVSSVVKSSYLILIMNIFPFIAVLFFRWEVRSIVYYYVAETIIIGFINILKMMTAGGVYTDNLGKTSIMNVPSRIGISIFFLFHYFFFVFVQLQFIMMAVGAESSGVWGFLGYFIKNKEAFIGLSIVLTMHLISFIMDYILTGAYKNMSPMIQMFIPYGRIFVQQIIAIIGGIVVLALGSPIALLLLLQVLKTVVEVISHYLTVAKYDKLSKIAEISA